MGGGPGGADLTRAVASSATPAAATPASRIAAAPSGLANDSAILSALSESDIARLLAIIEPPQAASSASRVDELLQAAIAATGAGDFARALSDVTQLATLDPLRAEVLLRQPALEPLHAEIESLLARLANAGKLNAETRVAEAARVTESGILTILPEWDARPEALLLIANRLLEAGGPANLVRATQVAQIIVDAAHWAPAAAVVPVPGGTAIAVPERIQPPAGAGISSFRQTWNAGRQHIRARVARWWRRAPLLLLLLAWLAMGIAGGTAAWVHRKIWPDAEPPWLDGAAFELWALGFLALVLFGFYMRVRNVRL